MLKELLKLQKKLAAFREQVGKIFPQS
jgi:hypothetical protein